MANPEWKYSKLKMFPDFSIDQLMMLFLINIVYGICVILYI